MAEKGKLLYKQDKRKYRNHIWFERIFLSILIMFPVIATIILLIEHMNEPFELREGIFIFVVIYGVSIFLIIFQVLPEAFGNRFLIFENGFYSPKTSLKYLMSNKMCFIWFKNIKKITIDKNYKKKSLIHVATYDGFVIGLYKNYIGEKGINLILGLNKDKIIKMK